MKDSYRIPDSLDRSIFDLEINIKNDSGMGLSSIPIKTVFGVVVAFFIGGIMIMRNPFQQASFPWQVGLIVAYILFCFVLLRPTQTGPAFKMIPAMMDYIPKKHKTLLTRNSSQANAFRDITNLKAINPDTGLIEFLDGSLGYAYRVVGSGSALLFESDRREIIDHTDRFFQKIQPGHQLIFITTKEPQAIGTQAAVMQRRYERLKLRDPELMDMMEHNFRSLRQQVGEESRSIHQYLILKAKNAEELKKLRSIFQAEAEGSAWVFKQARALFGEELYSLFRTIFAGKDVV